MQTKRVNFKVGPMRKAVNWSVYPRSYNQESGEQFLFVQSDKRALKIDLKTNKGMISNGKGHPMFASVTPFMGGKEIDVPQEIVDQCMEAIPNSGDKIGSANSIVSIL